MTTEPKLNKSFSRRIGKSLSNLQEDLLANKLPKYLLEPSMFSSGPRLQGSQESDVMRPTDQALRSSDGNALYIAEIGIGMGDHFVTRARLDPDRIHIGFEPYLNGVANSIKLAEEQGVSNIRLWPDDMDLVFDKFPDGLFDEIYILFPDPWPKSRQQKRRIVNETRLALFVSKLKPKGVITFASDIDHYFDAVLKLMRESGYFEEVMVGESGPKGYTKTRYHLKAEEEDRIPRFLSMRKK